MYYTVYRVTNKVNGKIYVGVHKTNNLDDDYMGSGKYLRRAQEKHGIENFEKEILFVFDNPEDMYAKEAEIVNEDFLSEENTYNLNLGGTGSWHSCNNSKDKLEWVRNGRKSADLIIFQKYGVENPSQLEHSRKINSEKMKLKHKNGEVKYNNFYGKTHSEESKQKMSEAGKQRTGNKNSQFGTMWITNGVENRKIQKNEEVPDGWNKGRS